MKLGTETGSLVNHVLISGSKGAPVPEVGMGATMLMWSDRKPCTIVRVTPSQVHVQEDNATRTDSNGMSEMQTYEYTPNLEAGVQVFRKRKDGSYVAKGMTLRIGTRNKYHDFSF